MAQCNLYLLEKEKSASLLWEECENWQEEKHTEILLPGQKGFSGSK